MSAVLEDLNLYRWSFENYFNRFSNGTWCMRNWDVESPGEAQDTEVCTGTDYAIEKECIVTLQDSVVSA